MAKIIIKNNIKKAIEEFDKEKMISSVAGDVAVELENKEDFYLLTLNLLLIN